MRAHIFFKFFKFFFSRGGDVFDRHNYLNEVVVHLRPFHRKLFLTTPRPQNRRQNRSQDDSSISRIVLHTVRKNLEPSQRQMSW